MTKNTKIVPSELKLDIPADVLVYEVNGPLFFGVAESLHKQLLALNPKPRAFIFRLNNTPLIDASRLHVLHEVAKHCQEENIAFHITEVQKENLKLFHSTGLEKAASLCPTLQEAIHKTTIADKNKVGIESCS